MTGSDRVVVVSQLMLGMMIDLFLGQATRFVAAIGKVNKLNKRYRHVGILGEGVDLGTLIGGLLNMKYTGILSFRELKNLCKEH